MELISSMLARGLVALDMKASAKNEMIAELVELLTSSGGVNDRTGLLSDVMARESLESTGLGHCVGLPHCRTEHVTDVAVVFGRPLRPVEYGSLDGAPVSLVFLVVSPSSREGDYIKILARLSRLLRKEEFRAALIAARTPDDVVALFAAEGA
jgi:PTS system fructose-specific IIC component